MKLNQLSKLSLAIGATLIIGCGGSDDPQIISNGVEGATPAIALGPDSGALRVVHGSSDSPKVNVLVDEEVAISALDYRDSSGFQVLPVGSYDIAVEGIVPGDNVEVISIDGFEIEGNSRTTVIAVNSLENIEPLVVTDTTLPVDEDQVGIQVVHGATGASQVDVYVTAPEADITSLEPSLSVDYKEQVDVGAISAEQIQIRVTEAGSKDVIYDSGTLSLEEFAGQKLLLVAADTTTAVRQAAAPVQILAITDSTTLALLDEDTGAAVQVVHLSPNAGAAAGGPVEVFASSEQLGPDPIEIIDAFSYGEVAPSPSELLPVPAGDDYSFTVAPNTNSIEDGVFNVEDVLLGQGSDYTVIAAGLVGGTPEFNLIVTENQSRSIASQAQLNVIHGAPAAGNVDIYVTPSGSFDEESVREEEAALPQFSFGTVTGNIDLTPGSYDIRVFAGDTLAINLEGASLEAGSVTTAIARGPSESAPLPDDFNLVLLAQ